MKTATKKLIKSFFHHQKSFLLGNEVNYFAEIVERK